MSKGETDMTINKTDEEILNELMGVAEEMFGTAGKEEFNREARQVNFDDQQVKSSYRNDDNGTPIFENMRHNQKNNTYRMTPDKVVITEPTGFWAKRKAKLLETNFGASYAYRESFKHLLDSGVSRLVANGAITGANQIFNVAIEKGIIKLHKFEIDPSNLLDPMLGNTLYDMVDYDVLFDKFKNMKHLRLDSEATEELVCKYGSNPQTFYRKIFLEKGKYLRILELDGKQFKRDCNIQELADLLGYKQLEAELDYVSASKNPKKEKMKTAEKRRWSLREKLFKGNGWGSVREKFKLSTGAVRTASLFMAGAFFITGNWIGSLIALNAGERFGKNKRHELIEE